MEINEITSRTITNVPQSAIVQPAAIAGEEPSSKESRRTAARRIKWVLPVQPPRLMALPPFPQTARELNAILSDPQLFATLGQAEAIQSVTRTEHGYVIATKNYSVPVDVVYTPSPNHRMGPVHFNLEFGNRTPSQSTPNSVSEPSAGALPPLAQSIRELSALLNDRRLFEKLGSAALLERIEKTNSGYLLTTAKNTLAVDIVYFHTDDGVGPVQFELVFGNAVGRGVENTL